MHFANQAQVLTHNKAVKTLQIVTLALLVSSCSFHKPSEPTGVVLTYGEETMASAKIREDGTFDVSKSSESENVLFSGTVSKQDEKYRIDAAFSRQIKSSNSSTELDTTILLSVNEQAVIGGVNDEVYSVALE